ncbi:hypothetical protein [Agrobacterium tumefaciens]|uniref:hypothetical protein n=1 Tax=Agrobacterium tumefaciens TaxID=358 RepID=UPI00054E4094|nr:hypothetical protein [Agrobacterium tumefaciens]
MSKTATLYDKTGAAFKLDHEHNGTLYVRPLVKVVMQSTNYHGDDFHEEVDFEPADYIVAKAESDLFYAPPVEAVDADLAAKQAELDALKAESKKVISDLQSKRFDAERKLSASKAQLDRWMETHRVMMDLGKLLDGKVLYPLSVSKNGYHHAREIPRIPEMRQAAYLAITSGDFERGQKWVCKQYAEDSYRTPFMFFETEEERAAVILSEFEATCAQFRVKTDFGMESYGTTLSYGLLLKWVQTHPALSIPDDIKEMKAAHDAALVEQRKAALAAELAAMSAAE